MMTADTLMKVLALEEALGGFGSMNPDKSGIRPSRRRDQGSLLVPCEDGISFRRDPKTGEYLPNW